MPQASAHLAGKISCVEASHLAWIRDFIRGQFSPIRGTDSPVGGWAAARRSRARIETFAQVPVLNQQQVVSVWKWSVPAHEQWESMTVAVPVSDKGVYLVEARWQTARLHHRRDYRGGNHHQGRRGTADELRGRSTQRRSHRRHDSAVWIDQKEVASKTTDQQGLVDTHINDAKPENVAVLATRRRSVRRSTRRARGTGQRARSQPEGLHLHRSPVYRPGDTVHFKSIVRAQTSSAYTVPQGQNLSLEMRDPQTYEVM